VPTRAGLMSDAETANCRCNGWRTCRAGCCGIVDGVPFCGRHQAVVNRRQCGNGQREAQQGNEQPCQLVVLAIHSYTFDAPPAQSGSDGMDPGPQVTPAIQVEAVQSKLASHESQPGRDGLVFLSGCVHAVDYQSGCAGGGVLPNPQGLRALCCADAARRAK
jgi:hypothetical protein